MSNRRARVRVGSTRRRIIWRARSGSRISPSSVESRTAPSLSAAAKISPWVRSDSICWPIRLDSNLPRYRNPTASSARGNTLTAMIRRVSGETGRQRKGPDRIVSARRATLRGSPCGDHSAAASGRASAASDRASSGGFGSAVTISIADAIEGFDLRELRIHVLKLLAQALDVAVDRPVVDINVLAIGGIHQLVAVFDVAGALRQRFEDQELGHRQFDRSAAPAALMARRVEGHLAAYDDRLGLAVLALPRQFAAPDQSPDALDQQPLREWLADIIVGAHAQA